MSRHLVVVVARSRRSCGPSEIGPRSNEAGILAHHLAPTSVSPSLDSSFDLARTRNYFLLVIQFSPLYLAAFVLSAVNTYILVCQNTTQAHPSTQIAVTATTDNSPSPNTNGPTQRPFLGIRSSGIRMWLVQWIILMLRARRSSISYLQNLKHALRAGYGVRRVYPEESRCLSFEAIA